MIVPGLTLPDDMPKLSAKDKKLKCPFCKGSALRLEYVRMFAKYSLVCEGCTSHGPMCDTLEEAISKYNCIVPKSAPVDKETVIKLRAVNTAWTKIAKQVGASVARCKACLK